MYSQAPNASFSGTCETAKHHVFQVPNSVKNTTSNVTFWRPKDNVQSSTQSLVLGHLRNSQTQGVKNPASNVTFWRQPNTMYLRSQKASKTQPLTSLSNDLKPMYSQAPNASFSGTCETAKHHVFQVPNSVKNTTSNVTFWRPKDNAQSSTQSLVLGHLRNSQTQGVKNPASNVTFWRPKDNVQSSIQSLVLNVQSSTQSLVLGNPASNVTF